LFPRRPTSSEELKSNLNDKPSDSYRNELQDMGKQRHDYHRVLQPKKQGNPYDSFAWDNSEDESGNRNEGRSMWEHSEDLGKGTFEETSMNFPKDDEYPFDPMEFNEDDHWADYGSENGMQSTSFDLDWEAFRDQMKELHETEMENIKEAAAQTENGMQSPSFDLDWEAFSDQMKKLHEAKMESIKEAAAQTDNGMQSPSFDLDWEAFSDQMKKLHEAKMENTKEAAAQTENGMQSPSFDLDGEAFSDQMKKEYEGRSGEISHEAQEREQIGMGDLSLVRIPDMGERVFSMDETK